MDSRIQPLDDPFWSVLAARHPDLEVVLVPGTGHGPDVSTHIVEATAAQVAAMVETVDQARTTLGLPSAARLAQVVPGPEPDTVQVRLKHSAADPEGAAVLDRIAASADTATRRDGEVVGLNATAGPLRVRGTWARGSEMLVLRVESPALRVGAQTAAELLGRS